MSPARTQKGHDIVPTVTIEIRKKYTQEEECNLINCVHQAMMNALKTPEWDKNIRLIVHEPHRFTGPPNKTDKYTLISFDMFSGRSIEAKRELYKLLVASLEAFGIPKDDTLIVLREHKAENWGIQGGLPASEVDIGFSINV